ncbi:MULTISPECIES: MFS transporter [unclassified Butyrivibrio]|uniref:MFS transporter n=1 Tax=unclassified Butyrivibrio TaxID=2639466 RepID=UPI0003B6A778|nr:MULTISPECIES: MFS transporter [unclassified Butyrivibrio]
MDDSKRSHDFLWIVLFLIVFINGFEAGGYQASLWNIGKNYDLSVTTMGLFASVELFATMLAPLILGGWADRTGKAKCITILLALQITAATLIFFTDAEKFFIGGVFFLGLTTSALQFISIAALIDAYPISGSKKIGYITSMYAFGALTSPLIVNYYLGKGLSWRTLFALLAIGSTVSLIGLFKTKNTANETAVAGDSAQSKNSAGEFIIGGILLLCTIMCIYVGFENGFAFFVDTLFTDVLKSGIGKYALSLFWAVMIPSRVIVGHFSKYARQILLTATAAIPIITIILTNSENSMLVLLLCIPLGFASGAIYPCVLNIMKTMAGKKTATATGMITTATGIGGVVFTALTGKFGDLFGLRKAIMCLAGFFIISFLSAYFAGKIHNRNNM